MELKMMLFAAYASTDQENRLTIAGTLDSISFTRAPQAPPEPTAVPIPPIYIVAIMECGLAEGTVHHAQLRILDADHKPVLESPMDLGNVRFVVNPHGRPMRFQAVIQLNGLVVPGPGDYVFEFVIAGNPLGSAMLYVDEAQHQ